MHRGIISRKSTKFHYKLQLFFSLFIVGMLILTISIGISFRWFNKYIHEEINLLAKSQLDNINTAYETNMEHYRQLLQTLFGNPGITSLLLSSDTLSFYQKYNTSRYLQTILAQDSTIDYILLFSDDEILMNTGCVYPSSEEIENVLQQVQNTKNDKQHIILNQNNEKQLCMIKTERNYLNGKCQNGVIMVTNLQKLQDKFIANDKNNSDAIIILNEDKVRILEENANLYFENSELWNSVDINNIGYDSFETVIEGNKYIGNYLVNDNPRYAILTLQDFQNSLIKIIETKHMMIIVSFGILFITLIVSFLLTQVLYKPIEKIRNKIRNNWTLILPEEKIDETKQIDETIDKIIGKVTMLSEQHNHDEVINYLHAVRHEGGMPRILELKNRDEQAILALCTIETDNNEMNYKHLREIFKETLIKEFSGCKVYIFIENKKSFLIFIKELTRINSFYNKVEVRRKFDMTLDNCEKQFAMNLHISLSDTITEDLEIEHTYRRLNNYMKYYLMTDLPRIIDEEYVSQNIDESVPSKNADKIMQSILEGSVKEAVEQINPLLKQLNKYKIERVMLFLAEFTANLNNFKHKHTVTSWEYKEQYTEKYLIILSCNNHEELINWLTSLVTNTCFELSVSKEKSLRTNMLSSIEYIQNNYMDGNLSVEALADQFHISTSYFSRLFNEYTGTTFPEYVNDLRLSHAKELLINNSLINMKKIAASIGFNSVPYFSAQFKKKYGISPSQFRNNI